MLFEGDPSVRNCSELVCRKPGGFPLCFSWFFSWRRLLVLKSSKIELAQKLRLLVCCWFFCLFVKLSKLFNHSDCKLILKLNLMLVLYGLFVAARTKIISSPVSFDMKTMMIVQ